MVDLHGNFRELNFFHQRWYLVLIPSAIWFYSDKVCNPSDLRIQDVSKTILYKLEYVHSVYVVYYTYRLPCFDFQIIVFVIELKKINN